MGYSKWGATAEDMKDFPILFKTEIKERIEAIAQENLRKTVEEARKEEYRKQEEKIKILNDMGVGLETTDELQVKDLMGDIGERVDWNNVSKGKTL